MSISIVVTDSDPAVEELLLYLASTKLSIGEQCFLLERTKDWLQRMDKHTYSATASVVVALDGNQQLTEKNVCIATQR
jgi:hypothetical protein